VSNSPVQVLEVNVFYLPIAAGQYIYRGDMVQVVDGCVKKATNSGNTVFGIAREEIDNSNGADGDQFIKIQTDCNIQVALDGFVAADILTTTYVKDEKTVTTVIGAIAGILVVVNDTYNVGVIRINFQNALRLYPSQQIREVAVTQSILPTDDTILVNTISGAINLTLPAPLICIGKIFNIKVIDNTNLLTILPNGSELIDGESSVEIDSKYSSINIQSDGPNWWII